MKKGKLDNKLEICFRKKTEILKKMKVKLLRA